jgi:DNA gyrase subunit A
MAVSDIKVAGRATQGVRLINIKEGDSIAAISAVNKSEEDNQVQPAEQSSDQSVEQTSQQSNE